MFPKVKAIIPELLASTRTFSTFSCLCASSQPHSLGRVPQRKLYFPSQDNSAHGSSSLLPNGRSELDTLLHVGVVLPSLSITFAFSGAGRHAAHPFLQNPSPHTLRLWRLTTVPFNARLCSIGAQKILSLGCLSISLLRCQLEMLLGRSPAPTAMMHYSVFPTLHLDSLMPTMNY